MAEETFLIFDEDSHRRVDDAVNWVELQTQDPETKPRVQRTPLPFQFRRFELAEPFAMNTALDPNYPTAWAYHLNPLGRVEDGTKPTDRSKFVVTDILNTRFGLGNGELAPPYDRGSQGTCYHPHDVDRWEVVDMRAINMMRFELKYDLAPGGTVEAYYLDATGSIQAGVVFLVTDFLRIHRGVGAQTSDGRGSQGYAWYFHDAQRFEILHMDTAPTRGGVFPVVLTQTSGSQGTAEEPASWVYDVTDALTGVGLLEDADPTADPHQWRRPNIGWMRKATFGYAHYNLTDQLIIGWTNEVVEQEACESSE